MFRENKWWFVHIFGYMFWLPEPVSTLALVASGFVLRIVVSTSDKCVLCNESNEKLSLNLPGDFFFFFFFRNMDK